MKTACSSLGVFFIKQGSSKDPVLYLSFMKFEEGLDHPVE